MACDRFVEAISAMIDGEEPEIDPRLVDAHVARCGSCADFQRSSESARRRLVVREVRAVRPVNDLSGRVRSLTAVADRAAAWRLPRAVLAVVAIEVIVLSVGDLVAAGGDGERVHDARHLSAFTIAYGVLLLGVVVRPARARTALPVAGVLAAALAITAVADLAAGRVPLVNETLHLPEIVSVILIWLLAVPGPRRWGGRRQRDEVTPTARPHLTRLERDAG
jgi:predicted anti-sigma-YlaC factor YlaD